MNYIFISKQANQALIDYMSTRGTVILVPRDERFDPRIACHPDLILSIIDGNLLIDAKAPSSLFQQLEKYQIPYILSHCELSATYPKDIAYNAVITKDYLIHNLEHTNPIILQHCNNTKKDSISVKQGYTKCSTVVVNDNSLITSDGGIFRNCKNDLNVLAITEGHVLLEGFETGFLGGASGLIDDTVVFHGDLSRHPDFVIIKEFIERSGKQVHYFEGFVLTDIGSIFVYPYTPQVSLSIKAVQKHVNIPVFISHEGCPNDCVFCNQRKITAKPQAMTVDEIREQIETYSSTLEQGTFTELAFFGGSFTGIDEMLQERYLNLAYEYKRVGKIHGIRLSTRPDYINTDILNRLKTYGVDTIELGIQSFHEEVLLASNRGHSVRDIYQAVRLIKAYGFQLGIQLMVGLPQDTKELCIRSASLAALLKPDFVRIYPTLVIRETELLEMSKNGQYAPLSLEAAVEWTKEMYRVFLKSHISVIRIGLQPTDLIQEGKEVLYGPFHPAFRQLVESSYFLDEIRNKLKEYASPMNSEQDILVCCNPRDLSQVIGHKRTNVMLLRADYPNIRIMADEQIKPMTLRLNIS